jgi:hypothetical protein
MRHICLFILNFFYSFILFAQNNSVADDYGSARSVIKDLDLIVSPNGIQENYEVNIGGLKQWAYVRGQNRDNPLILFVHGGPASPMAPIMWMYQRPLEEYFTVVQYDQRASGKTYLANDTAGLASSILADQYANDAMNLPSSLKRNTTKKRL